MQELLDLLRDPQELYRQAGVKARQALNRTFFEKVYLDADDQGPFVAADDLGAQVRPLAEIARGGTTDVPGGAASDGDLLRAALAGAGSITPSMVEVPGIEPGSFVALLGLLRAQLAVPLLGPTDHASESV